MLKLFKRHKTIESSTADQVLIDGLQATRKGFLGNLTDFFFGKKKITDDILEEIETRLLLADVGIETTQKIMTLLEQTIPRKSLDDAQIVQAAMQRELIAILQPCQQPLLIANHHPFVILVVGVNGVGKTTTIGKLAKRLQDEGKSVLLAAGDTFRAAAVQQLQAWGERNDITVVAQQEGADTAAVIYDALQSARAKNIDVVLADTAGRLHTQDNLMAELAKVTKVIKKFDPSAPHEVMLVLDAGIGQNAIQQVKRFKDAVAVTSITLTKLDGTAKGGVIFALANTSQLPIRFIGVGEAIEDLQTFNAEKFVDALFAVE